MSEWSYRLVSKTLLASGNRDLSLASTAELTKRSRPDDKMSLRNIKRPLYKRRVYIKINRESIRVATWVI